MDIYNIYEKKILEVLKSKTAKHEEEMMKSNFVQLSWNDTSKKVLEAGTYIVPFADGVKYRLLDDYEPKQKTEASFEYAPEFQHPIMMLGKIPFILTTGDTTSFQTADKETDWVYTGVASTIIQKIVDYINIIGAEIPDIGTGWFAVIDADIIGSKTCTFSAMDVLSAISECCNQWSCEYYLHYETKALYFGKVGIGDAVTLKVGENIGIPSVSESKEGYYNAFLVKGSMRNISQRSASGENTSVNKRLTLDPVKYPYGYIDKRENTAEPLMVKELIFEEVYPKLDLYVYNPRCRTRYLKDDDGNTVPGIDGKPKKYAVWYIRLAYLQNGVWMDYKITDDVVLSNKYQADNVGYYYNRYGNADHLTYKYAVFTNADFDAKWFTNKVTCQTSYSQYYVTVKAGDIVETAIAINNNGTLVLLIGESYTNYNSARNDSRGKAFRLAAQKDGIILQKYITEANIPSDYRHSQILDGMELSMSFQANENENALPSPLAGQEFKLRYHKDAKTIRANTEDGDSGMSVLAGDFEIVFEEGDIIIPTTIDGELYPRGERTPSLTGNKAILFNLAMDERYKAQAYLDLETTANKEIERLCSDLNNYTFPSNPVVFEKELTNPHLHVGMKVKYDDGQGYTLDTRVLKLVTQLDFEFKQSITVGNEQIKGTISELREQIQQISTGGGGTGSGGGVNISELKNMLMYYGRNYFLSKQSDDYTPYNLGIGKTLNVGENVNVGKDLHVDGNAKVDGDVDIDGFLKVLAAYISKIQSSNYTGDGLNDTGFKITNDKDGHSYLVVDELLVRMKAVFNELEVRKMTYSGGNVVYSGAGSKIFRVEYLKKASPDAEDGEVLGYTVVKVPWLLYGSPLAIENYVLGSRKKVRTEVNMAEVTHFRCYLIADDGTMATTNWWEAYDQARCQTFNLSKNGRNAANGTDSVNTYGIDESNLQNNFYWRLVSRVGQQRLEDDKVYNYVDLSKTDCLAGSGIPVAGDSIVQFGNRSKVERQNVITLEVIGEDAPAIKEYMGINSYDLTNKRRTMISPRSGDEFYATRFVIVTSYGAQYPIPVDRGLWLNIPLDVKGHRRCYYYDRLSHNGSTWLCMVADGWHYEDANGNVVSSDTEGAIRTRNYTTDEPSLTSQDWQISVEKGERGYATFKSLVFKRAASKPAKPAANEGSFQSPVPSGWSDGIPTGSDTIWMTSRIFTSDGGGIQEAAWTNVELMSDTETFDVEFAKLQPNRAKPAEPNYATNAIKGDTSANKIWYDPSEIDDVNVKSEDMVWMATRTKDNGVWGNWTIAKIKGEDGGFKSSVFARTNTRPVTPAGGTYESPYPTTPANVWHDGIPNGEAQIWMSVCTFWPDGSSSGWSQPQPQSDTDTLDIEFSPSATKPTAPSGNTPFANHEAEGWYDPSSANFATAGTMIWRAERKVSNGEYDGSWVITRIYGEKGDTGLRGNFKSTVFKRTNTAPATPSGGTYDSPVPSGWSDGIPAGTAQIWASSCTFYGNGGNSGWSTPQPQSDTDTLDIEFSPSSTEPTAPSGNTPFANHEAEGWYDPSSANFATAGTMIWRAERKVSNGEYDGSWVITRIYGEKGNPGNNAKGTKMRFTAAMSASATAPTLATVNNFTWYDTAASPTESYPCVYCSIWEINYDGSLVQCLSVSLFNRYGKTGNNGSDAYSFQLSAPSVIIGQATTSPYSMLIDGTPTGNTATSIIVRKGNKACTVNITSLSTYHCNASRTYGGTTYSNIFWITAVLTDSNSNYYETGYVEVTFTVTDPDNSSNTFSTTLRFNFYCNLMGTWKMEIKGDIETSIANRQYYTYDADGNVVSNQTIAEYIRSSSINTSTMKKTVDGHTTSINTIAQTAEENKSSISDLKGNVSNIVQTQRQISMEVLETQEGYYQLLDEAELKLGLKSAWDVVNGNYRILFHYTGSSVTLRISAPNHWTISSDSTWCTINQTEGSGETFTTLTTSYNYGSGRTATLTLTYDGKTEYIYVYQYAYATTGSTSLQSLNGCYSIYKKADTSNETDVLQQELYRPDESVLRIQPSRWYTFSFYVCGSGSVRTFIYPGSVDTSEPAIADGNEVVATVDGFRDWTLTSSWVRHTYTFRTKSILSDAIQKLLFRLQPGASEVYICCPRLELGTVAHNWGVDMLGLKRTGIDIKNGKIILDAETAEATGNFIVKRLLTNGGETGVHVEIQDGVMNVFGSSGIANWRFGVDDDGNAILSYYDNTGTKVYDLGPEGLTKINNTSEAFIQDKTNHQLKTIGASDNADTVIRGVLSSATMLAEMFNQSNTANTYYRYRAKKTVTDGTTVYYEGIYASSAAIAKAADQKLFTSLGDVNSTSKVNAVCVTMSESIADTHLKSCPDNSYEPYKDSYATKVVWGGSQPIYCANMRVIQNGVIVKTLNVWSNTKY